MDTQTLPAPAAPARPAENRLVSRTYGGINWLGLQTLVAREVQRFMKVSAQTVIAPLTSTVLFLSIFAALLGARHWGVTEAVPYINGLVPGLAMMAIISNAFQNSASSLIIAKVQGNAVDFLMPPISALELTIAFLAGSAARGLIVGLASVLIAAPFADIVPVNWFAALYFALMGAIVFGAIGLIGGIWADKFDHLAAV
ncbi:MAG: multidrug ABC transporter permease, partial [Hyphomonadaceae bacterium]